MEHVILLDEAGNAIGTADKAEVHHRNTPLHLAFSCYVINDRNELLLTRRAAGKRTWPGVWTNSCCGHPGPGEPLAGAVLRRLAEELGIQASAVDLVLPGFRYRAVMDNGVVENEICPVFRVRADTDPDPDPREVDAYRWTDWTEFADAVNGGRLAVSPWCTEQVRELSRLGPDARAWPAAAGHALPAAARGDHAS